MTINQTKDVERFDVSPCGYMVSCDDGKFTEYANYMQRDADALVFESRWKRVEAELTATRARLAEAEVNEARYLFLRDSAENQTGHPFIARRNAFGISAWNGHYADAAIDAAIALRASEVSDENA